MAFVFDITGSMYDDLVQVIKGAAEILQDALTRREKPLYNYVLVPFHDPGECVPHTILHTYLHTNPSYDHTVIPSYEHTIIPPLPHTIIL